MSEPPPERPEPYRAAPGDPLRGLVRHHVYLRDVDVRRFLAAERYVTQILREFTLIRLGRRSGLTAADYPYRLLEIIDEIVTTYAASRHDIKRQALEALARGDEMFSLHAMSPREAAPMASRFGELLVETVAFARDGHLLVVPPSDDQTQFIRSFYERLASEVGVADDPVAPQAYATFIASMAAERGAPRPMPGGARMIELPFEAELAAPAVIRRMVRETLARWGHPELAESVILPATELLSNAVLHTRRPGRFVMLMSDMVLRVEVHDLDTSTVERARQDDDATTGYGLLLVEALVSSWGRRSDDTGKVVWFEVEFGEAPDAGSGERAAELGLVGGVAGEELGGGVDDGGGVVDRSRRFAEAH